MTETPNRKRRTGCSGHVAAPAPARSRRQTTPPSRRKQPAKADWNLYQPAAEALKRFEAIPLLFAPQGRGSALSGRVVFDSWSQGAAPALRDATDGHVRRLRLAAGQTTLEILAERRSDRWEFVARAYRGREAAHDFVLKVGSRRLLSRSGGYYHWSARSVPRSLALLSYRCPVVFGGLIWR